MITEARQREILSENLKYYINRAGKSQHDIAVDIGVNPPTFNQWVNGKAIPSVAVLKNVAEYFHIALSDLVYERPNPRLAETRKLDDFFKPYMTSENLEILVAYVNAEEWKRQSIRKLLDIPEAQGESLISQAG